MTDAPPLAYASPADADDAMRRVRRCLALAGIAYASIGLFTSAIAFATATGFLGQTTISFGRGAWMLTQTGVDAAALAGLLAASIATLREAPLGLTAMRITSAVLVLTAVASSLYWRITLTLRGGAGVNAPAELFVGGLLIVGSTMSLPALICLLTFPLRGRPR